MRYFRLYHNDPFYQTSDASIMHLCREIFRTEQGCSDGYKKIWKEVCISWGSEKLGGYAEVKNHWITTTEVKVKAWQNGREFETSGIFWTWHQLYDWLSSVILDYVPTFCYNSMHVYTVDIVVDFYSFSVAFDFDDFDREVERLYKKLIVQAPWGATIYSDDGIQPYVEIHLDNDEFQFKSEDGKFIFYLPTIENLSQFKKFMKLILAKIT